MVVASVIAVATTIIIMITIITTTILTKITLRLSSKLLRSIKLNKLHSNVRDKETSLKDGVANEARISSECYDTSKF